MRCFCEFCRIKYRPLMPLRNDRLRGSRPSCGTIPAGEVWGKVTHVQLWSQQMPSRTLESERHAQTYWLILSTLSWPLIVSLPSRYPIDNHPCTQFCGCLVSSCDTAAHILLAVEREREQHAQKNISARFRDFPSSPTSVKSRLKHFSSFVLSNLNIF